MEARVLFELSRKMQRGQGELIESFLCFLNPKKDDLVFFKDFKSYLNKNILLINPNIENTTKSDVDLFIQLTTDPAIKIILDRENKHVRTIEAYVRMSMDTHEPLLHSLIACSFYLIHNFVTKYIEILISQGADINITNKFGQTPLMYAAYIGKSFCLQKLLDLNAEIDYDNSVYTAIDYAVSANEENTLRMLLSNGAKLKNDVFYKNHFKTVSKSVLQLINESKTFKWLRIEDLVIKKIDEATTKTLPLDLIKIIASYDASDARASLYGYFKVIKNNAEEKYIQQEFKKACTIM